jgi:hypothetical protein
MKKTADALTYTLQCEAIAELLQAIFNKNHLRETEEERRIIKMGLEEIEVGLWTELSWLNKR